MATILVVDDDQALTDFLRYALEREGLTVCTTHSGRDAVRLVRKDSPDLIVLGAHLPDMNGLAVLCTVRTFSPAPMVMLIGWAQEEDVIAGFVHGADDYVTKPLSVPVLVSRIKAVLRRAAHAREVRKPG